MMQILKMLLLLKRLMAKILALDTGNDMGWAFYSKGKVIASGTKELAPNGENEKTGARWKRMRKFLKKFKGIDLIVFEDVMGIQMRNHMQSHFGYMSLLEEWAYENKVDMTGYKQMTLKKKFTNNGWADKAEICAAAHKLGWEGGKPGTEDDDDEADALALLYIYTQDNNMEFEICPKIKV